MEKVSSNRVSGEVTKISCWSRFRRIFENRGFDLEYEYNDTRSTTVLNENFLENNKKFERKKTTDNNTRVDGQDTISLDGELSGVINFYEQFATLGDDVKEDEQSWRWSSSLKHRVSMRPSMHLTNIIEETSSLGDPDLYETELVSCTT